MSEPYTPQVGDEIAFDYRTGLRSCRYIIEKITRITPTGRIVCGKRTLNPDLSIRGDCGFGGPFRGIPVTDEIRESVRRSKIIETLGRYPFGDMSTAGLEAVMRVLEREGKK